MFKSKIIFLTLLVANSLLANSAEDILQTHGCFSCHAIASQKAGPAFAGIAKRNLRFEGSNAKATIINSIQHGSHGKYPHFSMMEMPAFPEIATDDLNSVADFILAQASKAKGHGGMGKGAGKMKGCAQ